jgi:hypothetical protein
MNLLRVPILRLRRSLYFSVLVRCSGPTRAARDDLFTSSHFAVQPAIGSRWFTRGSKSCDSALSFFASSQ